MFMGGFSLVWRASPRSAVTVRFTQLVKAVGSQRVGRVLRPSANEYPVGFPYDEVLRISSFAGVEVGPVGQMVALGAVYVVQRDFELEEDELLHEVVEGVV